MSDFRLVRVNRLLERHGVSGAASVAGHDAAVLALRAPVGELARVRALVPELKALGFRYVTLELNGEQFGTPQTGNYPPEESR